MGKLKMHVAFIIAITLLFVVCGNIGQSNETEKPSMPVITNTTIETSTLDSTSILVDITTKDEIKEGKRYTIQSAILDLDNDKTEEQITAYFSSKEIIAINGESPINYYDTCEILIVKLGEEYLFTWSYEDMVPYLNFADFDSHDESIQFYLEGNGPSGDPYTQIFSFNGTQILKNVGFTGFITSYDGAGKIYSYDIYNVNCYYDLIDGLTPLPKDSIVGTEIQRDFNILLCTKPGEGYTAAILSYYYENDDFEHYIDSFKDEFMRLVPANTPLIVLDIEFLGLPWDSDSDKLYNVPWLKVKTPDGIEGWFCVVYGD